MLHCCHISQVYPCTAPLAWCFSLGASTHQCRQLHTFGRSRHPLVSCIFEMHPPEEHSRSSVFAFELSMHNRKGLEAIINIKSTSHHNAHEQCLPPDTEKAAMATLPTKVVIGTQQLSQRMVAASITSPCKSLVIKTGKKRRVYAVMRHDGSLCTQKQPKIKKLH